jgi:hypothetical protein
MVKMTILNMSTTPFVSSSGHGQMVKINRYFNNFNRFKQFQQQKNLDCHNQIWIDHSDYNYGTSIWPHGQKIVVIGPPPPPKYLSSSFSIMPLSVCVIF